MHFAKFLPSVAALVLASASVSADTALSIRTKLFALDAAATASIRVESDSAAPRGQAATRLIRPTGTLRWGDSSLQLQGETMSWTPKDRWPAGLKLIADTPLPVGPTGHAELRCIATAEYMERLPEGTFALRRIEADSPEAPRYVLAFQVERKNDASVDLAVTCRPEVAVARRHAPLEGVRIPIGKPLVDVFVDKLSFTVRKGQWHALLLRPPAPFETGVLALINIGDEAVASQPSAGNEPPRKPEREIEMVIAATRTAAETAPASPVSAAPAGYILYDGGLGAYGPSIGRPLLASSIGQAAGTIRAAWQDALAHAGYRPASAMLAPRVVLVYHWGVTREIEDPLPERALVQEWGALHIGKARMKAFVAISAYDQADFAAGLRTLLWRVRAETTDVVKLREVLPALITASTSWLGRDQEGLSTATIRLADQRVVDRPPVDNDPAAALTIDETRVHALIEEEQRAITLHHDFPVSTEERMPRKRFPIEPNEEGKR